MDSINKPLKYGSMLLLLPVVLLAGYTLVSLTDTKVTLFVWLNFWFQSLPDAFWAHMTFLVDTAAALALLGLFLAQKERFVMSAVVGGILCGIVIRLLKIYFDDPRPPAALNWSLFNIIGEPYRGHSFPSGHAATAFFISGLLVAFFRIQAVYWLALLFGVLGALSRVAVGVHWPTDILVGSAIGWIIGFGIGCFFNNRNYFSYPKRILVFLACYVSAVHLLVYDPNMPYVMMAQATFAAIGVFSSLYYLAFRILKV